MCAARNPQDYSNIFIIWFCKYHTKYSALECCLASHLSVQTPRSCQYSFLLKVFARTIGLQIPSSHKISWAKYMPIFIITCIVYNNLFDGRFTSHDICCMDIAMQLGILTWYWVYKWSRFKVNWENISTLQLVVKANMLSNNQYILRNSWLNPSFLFRGRGPRRWWSYANILYID